MWAGPALSQTMDHDGEASHPQRMANLHASLRRCVSRINTTQCSSTIESHFRHVRARRFLLCDAEPGAVSSYFAGFPSVISSSCISTQPKLITRFEDTSILSALIERESECERPSEDALVWPTLVGFALTAPLRLALP